MGLFTSLTDDDVTEIQETFALGPVTDTAGIEAGTINSNYRVETASGCYFVRVNEGKSEDEVAYEARLVAYLQERGVPTPGPLRAADGRPYGRCRAGLVTVFPWVEGEHRGPPDLSTVDAARAGRALARLHRAGADFPEQRQSRYALSRIVERVQSLAADCCEGVLTSALSRLGDELGWLEEQAGRRGAAPAGIIHGDLFPDNVLFCGDEVALLDFEQASGGSFAYDLSVLLLAWCWHRDFLPEAMRAMRAGYEAERPLAAGERELLWVEARAVSARFAITRITDVYLNPDASPLVRATKDFRDYLARLDRLVALGPVGFGDLLGLGPRP